MFLSKDSTISNSHGVKLVLNTNPDIILNWKKLTAQTWETSFLSSADSRVYAGGLHSDGTYAAPASFLKNEGIQRPALYDIKEL